MSWHVEFRPDVREDVREIPANLYQRIQRAIDKRLGTSPDLYGERLAKDLVGLWKLRVGDYRVIFTMDANAKVVTVWCIRYRGKVYPEAHRRWHRR